MFGSELIETPWRANVVIRVNRSASAMASAKGEVLNVTRVAGGSRVPP